MPTDDYKKYILSPEWAAIRNDLYMTRGKKCQRCGSTKNIHIHHKTYKNLFHEEPKDLEILCAKCHMREHHLFNEPVKIIEKARPERKKKKKRKHKWGVKIHKKLKNPFSDDLQKRRDALTAQGIKVY